VAITPPTLIVMAILSVLPKNDILRLMLASIVFLSVLAICYDRLDILKFANVIHKIKSVITHRWQF